MDYFDDCGPMVSIRLPKQQNDTSKNRGFAFIVFDTPKGMFKAIEKSGLEITDGIPIRVEQ